MYFPRSTAVASNGPLHSSKDVSGVDLSSIQFTALDGSERSRHDMLMADMLLAAAEPPAETHKRKRIDESKELPSKPDSIRPAEDEHRPKRVRYPTKKALEALPTIIESPTQEAPIISPKRAESTGGKTGCNRAALTKRASSRAASTGPSKSQSEVQPKRASSRTVSTGRITKSKTTTKNSRASSRAPSAAPNTKPKSASRAPSRASSARSTTELKSAGRALSRAPSVGPAAENKSSGRVTRASSRARSIGPCTNASTNEANIIAASTNTVPSAEIPANATTTAMLSTTSGSTTTAPIIASSNITISDQSASTTAPSRNAASTITSSSAPIPRNAASMTAASAAPALPAGKVIGARGKLVDAKIKARMDKVWEKRHKEGKSGRNGGAPKADTVKKNMGKGVDYGDASKIYQK